MRIRLLNQQVAQILSETFALYIKYCVPADENGDRPGNNEIVKKIIEKNLLLTEITSEKDLDNAKKLAKNLLYANLGEWVESYMRQELRPYLSLCGNCIYLQENNYCPVMDCIVNPNLTCCDGFSKAEG